MSNRTEAYAHLARSYVRTGWYAVLHRMMHQGAGEAAQAEPSSAAIAGPMPSERALLADVLELTRRDSDNIANGRYAAPLPDSQIGEHLRQVRAMFADLRASSERRLARRGREAAELPQAAGLPEYYTQNFHFQTGGYLTAESAQLYDLQVETLFLGSAGVMRRQAILPIADFVRGRDQRNLRLLDVACGTGRFLGQVAAAFPAMRMTGVDLSAAYVETARVYLSDRRGIDLEQGNAEALPLADASVDIVTCVYLFHELPHDVRRAILAEMRRVLRPGGLLVLMDSAQTGDKPAYDGLLASFPVRFHEPYYREYLGDELGGLAQEAGFTPLHTSLAFLSKIVAALKPAEQA